MAAVSCPRALTQITSRFVPVLLNATSAAPADCPADMYVGHMCFSNVLSLLAAGVSLETGDRIGVVLPGQTHLEVCAGAI